MCGGYRNQPPPAPELSWWVMGRREGKALEKCSDPVPMLEQTYIQWKHTVSRSLMLGQKKLLFTSTFHY